MRGQIKGITWREEYLKEKFSVRKDKLMVMVM
jgi:hypothetical protein